MKEVEKMALKPVSYKLDEKRIEAIKAVCDDTNMKQADFLNLAIDNMIEKIAVEKSGGMSMTIPTPYIFHELNDDEKKQIIDLLNEAAYTFTRIAKGKLDLGLDLIKYFAVDRLNPAVSDEEKKRYLDSFYKYLDIKKYMKGDENV